MPAMPTVVTLNAEWEVTRHESFSASPFAGRTAGEVWSEVRGAPDATLLVLLTMAQAGEQLAGRTIVQALLGKLIRLAVLDQRVALDDLLACLWVRIATYPITRRPTSVAANLVLDARKDVLAEQRALRAVPGCPATDPDLSAVEVLDAAVSLGLIDQRSREILISVYGDGLGSAAAAGRHGTTATAIRWRCSRDVRRLATRSKDLWTAAA